MKQVNGLELTGLAALVAAMAMGCATSGSAQYDTDQHSMGVSADTRVGSSPSVSASAYHNDTTLYHPLATDRDRGASASASMGTDHDASMRANAYHTTSTGAPATAEVGAGTGATAQVNTYPAPSAQINAGVPGAAVSASADMGTTTTPADVNTHYYNDGPYVSTPPVHPKREGAARVTVSALSMSPETRPEWVNRFPFYSYNMGNIGQTYIFVVPDKELHGTIPDTDLPQFSVDLPPGSVFVESAGGAGEVRTGRVIQHSPNPTR